MKKNSYKFVLDIVLTVVFAYFFVPAATGLVFHEWGSVIIGLVGILHLIFNWKWVTCVSKKALSEGITGKARFCYVLNWTLFIDMLVILISGLFISKVVLPYFRYFPTVNWLPIHIVSSFVGLVIIGMHLGLHWNWIKQRFSWVKKFWSSAGPALLIAAYIILVVGTVTFLAQVPKQVQYTQAIFSDQKIVQGSGHGKRYANNQNGKKFQLNRNDFSIDRMIDSTPEASIYLAMLASLAFYMNKLEIRYLRK